MDDVPTPASLSAAARRIHRFEQALATRMASQVTRLHVGTARCTPDLPLVYHLSEVEITRSAAPVEVLPVVEAQFATAGLHHRRIATALPEVAWVLGPALVDRGWAPERLVVQVHDGTPPLVSATGFGVVDLVRWAPAARTFIADEEWGQDPAVQDQMAARDERLTERVDTQFVLDADGVAGCHVYRHGRIAQIENVHVRAEARGQGLGHGLMAAALDAAGDADTVFVVADADDWTPQWYQRLGFQPVGSLWAWQRIASTP